MAKDEYPQWMTMPVVTESAVGTYTTESKQTPVVRESSKVMEILAVEWELDDASHVSIGAASGDEKFQSRAQLTTDEKADIGSMATKGLIDKFGKETHSQFAEADETGGAGFSSVDTVLHNFAQGGKGFLTAAETFHLGVKGNSGENAVIGVSCRILYRLVKVSAEELLGLLTSLVG
mgnify:CR=1 FL=1|jgi:hypothetical protein